MIAVNSGSVTSPAVKRQAEQMLSRVAKLPEVASVASPYAAAGAAQISKSGQVAFASVTMTKLATSFTTTQAQQFVNTARAGAGNGLQVAVAGQVAEQSEPASDSSAGLGALAALVVLLRRVRIVSGRAPAAGHRRSRARRRRLRDRPALQPDHDGELQLPAVDPDRPRRRGRLRALHRHPSPSGPAAGQVGGGGDRRCDRHLRPCRDVRRDHRLHRAARDVRAGRQLPLRRRRSPRPSSSRSRCSPH